MRKGQPKILMLCLAFILCQNCTSFRWPKGPTIKHPTKFGKLVPSQKHVQTHAVQKLPGPVFTLELPWKFHVKQKWWARAGLDQAVLCTVAHQTVHWQWSRCQIGFAWFVEIDFTCSMIQVSHAALIPATLFHTKPNLGRQLCLGDCNWKLKSKITDGSTEIFENLIRTWEIAFTFWTHPNVGI